MQIQPEYQAALDYLYQFVDYSLTRQFRFHPDKFDLQRMVALLDRLGNPHRAYPVLHVAGTKGKGSVAALLASAYHASGRRVGLYTSPHLIEFTERIQVNGQPVDQLRLAELVEHLKPHVDQVPGLTTFELTTALGFLHFAAEAVDVAVIEVGLGGRLDATNVVDPLVAVITSLSMDHTAVLGDTLAKIAFEKAGIIKPGRPVISSPQKPEARQVLAQVATERGAPLIEVGQDYLYAAREHNLDGQSLIVWQPEEQAQVDMLIETGQAPQGWQPTRLDLPLLGYHQVVNAATAYAALQTAHAAGLTISPEAIRTGFRQVFWPGRFEVLSRDPLVIIDSAHNPDSALKLHLTLDDYLPGMPVVLVFGASEDKDVAGMFAELLPRVQRVVATESVHPRALTAEAIVAEAHRYGCPAEAVLPLEAALQRAQELAGTEAAVVITGSLFIAAAARQVWLDTHPGQAA